MTANSPTLATTPQLFIRFLICGGMAAAVNWSSRFLWSMIVPFGVAVFAAYVTGMLFAFLLFRAFVFAASKRPLQEQVRNFVIVNLVGMAATCALSQWLVSRLFPAVGMTLYPEAVGHALAIAAPIATSWFGHRMVTFR